MLDTTEADSSYAGLRLARGQEPVDEGGHRKHGVPHEAGLRRPPRLASGRDPHSSRHLSPSRLESVMTILILPFALFLSACLLRHDVAWRAAS
jgi:hypothetical protein